MDFKKNRFFIDAGPYLNLFLMNVYKSEYLNHLFIQKDTKDFRRLVLGMAAGFGANIPIGKKFDMSFEVRDNYNLTRICKNTVTSFTNKSKLSLNSELFIYSIAYHIKSKKK